MQSIYVGNLSHDATESDLSKLFSAHGEVLSAKIITDRYTQRSRGFAFVEMSEDDAQKAIKSLNGTDFMRRTIEVKVALPRENNGGGSRSGGNGGGFRRNSW